MDLERVTVALAVYLLEHSGVQVLPWYCCQSAIHNALHTLHGGFMIGVPLPSGTWMASLGSWVDVKVSFFNTVRQYSFPPWAPQSEEHRIIRDRSTATLVKTFPSSLSPGFP